MNKLMLAVLVFFVCSCNSQSDNYKELHDKYRTFWYRTNKHCFYDSSLKYGELYRISKGWEPLDINFVDTVKVDELTPNCK